MRNEQSEIGAATAPQITAEGRALTGQDVEIRRDWLQSFGTQTVDLRPIRECSWCSVVAPVDDSAVGEPICEDCYHGMDWHRSCDIGDPDTVCPFCGATLATHVGRIIRDAMRSLHNGEILTNAEWWTA